MKAFILDKYWPEILVLLRHRGTFFFLHTAAKEAAPHKYNIGGEENQQHAQKRLFCQIPLDIATGVEEKKTFSHLNSAPCKYATCC